MRAGRTDRSEAIAATATAPPATAPVAPQPGSLADFRLIHSWLLAWAGTRNSARRSAAPVAAAVEPRKCGAVAPRAPRQEAMQIKRLAKLGRPLFQISWLGQAVRVTAPMHLVGQA